MISIKVYCQPDKMLDTQNQLREHLGKDSCFIGTSSGADTFGDYIRVDLGDPHDVNCADVSISFPGILMGPTST